MTRGEGAGLSRKVARAVLKGPDFFFLLRTAPRDHQPPTPNSHQPPTATNRQPPTATNRQPPTAANWRRPTANCQPLPTATNHQSPTTNRRQPPPTATNRQLPTANHQPPPTANRHQPWLSTWSARGLFWENWFWNTFFFPVKDRPEGGGGPSGEWASVPACLRPTAWGHAKGQKQLLCADGQRSHRPLETTRFLRGCRCAAREPRQPLVVQHGSQIPRRTTQTAHRTREKRSCKQKTGLQVALQVYSR